jgi:hypothetical protein
MINPFLLSVKDRLNHWKAFRKTLADNAEQEQLEKVAEYWSHTPIQSIAYNMDEPDTWPTAWEMMSLNDWCRNSVAIGIEFTLRLTGWNPDRLKLKLILDRQSSVMVMTVVVDDKWILNYDWGIVTSYKPFGVCLKSYQWDNKKYIETE